MKVSELIEQLSRSEPNDRVTISVELAHPTVGGTPCVEVKSVESGFDWNQGKVLLNLEGERKLTVMSREEYLGHIRYKQLVCGMRGKEDISHLSDIFVKKDFVIGRLKDIAYRLQAGKLEDFEVNDLIADIFEEKF